MDFFAQNVSIWDNMDKIAYTIRVKRNQKPMAGLALITLFGKEVLTDKFTSRML
jgi:hypothetical protein